jgi:broad specificity phosphatase PhoE
LTIAVAPELLVLVRHGQSDRNVAKAGHVFFPDEESRAAFAGVPERQAALTELGWQQARALGVRLREEHERFDLVLHSGYRRTRETAEALLEAWPVDARAAMVVGEDPLLSERDAGHAVNTASRRVLLVTHNGTLRAFRSVLEGWTSDEFEQHLRGDGHANCAVLAYP